MLEAQLNDHTEVSCLDLLFSLSLAPSLIMVHFSCGRLNILAMYLLKKIFIEDPLFSRLWAKNCRYNGEPESHAITF